MPFLDVRYPGPAGCLGATGFNRLLKAVKPKTLFNRYVTIDLARTTTINAIGLVGLTLLLVQLRRQGNAVTVEVPSGNGVYEYLSHPKVRVPQLCAALTQGVPNSTPGIAWRRLRTGQQTRTQWPSYTQLASFLQVEGADPLLVNVYSTLNAAPGFGADFARIFCAVISELCDNIESHSESPIGGVAAAELYTLGSHPRVVLALGDLGIGIRASLRRAAVGIEDTDAAAVKYALRLGTSSRKEENPGRGGGLAFCKQHAESNEYAFAIRSGSAFYLWETPSHSLGTLDNDTDRIVPFPGTQAFFGLRLDK